MRVGRVPGITSLDVSFQEVVHSEHKFLPAERSLIVLGGEIIAMLGVYPRSVSEIWEGMTAVRRKAPLTFDWFVLALTLLYTMNIVEMDKGLVRVLKAAA